MSSGNVALKTWYPWISHNDISKWEFHNTSVAGLDPMNKCVYHNLWKWISEISKYT